MTGPKFINPHLTLIDVDLGENMKNVVTGLLLPAASQLGIAHKTLCDLVLAREKQGSTVMPGGIAIPHGRIPGLSQSHLVFARLARPVLFDPTLDPCDLVFILLSPDQETDQDGSVHLKTLQNLVASLMNSQFTQFLREANDNTQICFRLAEAAGQDSLLRQAEKADTVKEDAVVGGISVETAPAGADLPTPVEVKNASASPREATSGTETKSCPLLVAVTSCPVGIAHTYMAADALLAAAREMQVVLKVEAQGAGPLKPIDEKYLEQAKAVIFANDVSVRDPERFTHLPAVHSRPKQAIANPKLLINKALEAAEAASHPVDAAIATQNFVIEREENANTESTQLAATDSVSGQETDSPSATVKANQAPVGASDRKTESPNQTPPTAEENASGLNSFTIFKKKTIGQRGGGNQLSIYRRIQQAVMAGVSYMIPFVAAGGVLTALGLLISDYQTTELSRSLATAYNAYSSLEHLNLKALFELNQNFGFQVCLGAILYFVGQVGMNLMIPALSGYISFGLAGRSGIAPGFIGGVISLAVGAGFIGALVTGIGSGVIAYLMGRGNYPPWLAGLMPIVLIPTLTSAIVGVGLVLFLGTPLRIILSTLQNWLGEMSESSAVLLGVVLGAMMCFDLGGPVNKVAMLFATAGLSEGTNSHPEPFWIMAAVMCAGMVPPFATAVATYLRPTWYSRGQREHAKASWLLGASFITEGAIPVAAADPLRVIPCLMVGGATAGGICMGLGVASTVPHGGLFVLFTIDPASGFLVALVAGTALAATLITIAKAIYFYNHPLPKLRVEAGNQA